jgi:hypothetical protein
MIATDKKEYILIHNHTDIHYASYNSSKITLLSYFSLLNDDFITFRNNLTLS